MDIYYQIPTPPAYQIPASGTIIYEIPAFKNVRNLLKAIYVDMVAGQTLSIQVDDNLHFMYFTGAKQGGIPFRCGVQFQTSIILTISGTAATNFYCGVVTNY